MIQEKHVATVNGYAMALLFIIIGLLSLGGLAASAIQTSAGGSIVSIVLGGLALIAISGFTVVNPNEAAVVQLFGSYLGSIKRTGFLWTIPLTSRKKVSLRIHNFESNKLKVNDHDGNPIEIAAVVVWQVRDSAEAMFEVEDYQNFIHVQSEAALRNLATSYPYDAHNEEKISLRGNTVEVANELKREIHERLSKAGIEVIEARISHLAYAPEIASAMLRRQQANAIIAARQRIVEGAVSMVEMALAKLEEGNIVKLDEERKAAMVSNLLVVLTSDRDAQPVVNTGTIY